MSMRDPLLYVDDILEAIAHIEQYTKGADRGAFLKDAQLQDAVIRRLEVIGEAVKKIPDEWRTLYPDLPWRAIAKTRDKLIHDYFGVDLEYIWDIIGQDLAPLKSAMRNILSSEESKKIIPKHKA
ncbi:DUF86 domain-containing protein [Candidatus Uhrbacteria bacterium]|nr:DUF86 domain-containing protein [Candidatus Uhrbacteria bacterium]